MSPLSDPTGDGRGGGPLARPEQALAVAAAYLVDHAVSRDPWPIVGLQVTDGDRLADPVEFEHERPLPPTFPAGYWLVYLQRDTRLVEPSYLLAVCKQTGAVHYSGRLGEPL